MKLIKTQTGQSAFKERSPLFTVRQRSAFLLCDGKKEVAMVLAATASMGVTQADVDHLIAQGLLAVVAEPVPPLPPLMTAPDSADLAAPAEAETQERSRYVENWTMF